VNPRPLCIGSGNAVAMTGHSWRWLRDHAEELGVAIVKVDGKAVIIADELLAALEKRRPAPVEEPIDELEMMRERVRRAG
jgi:hypothetical protein